MKKILVILTIVFCMFLFAKPVQAVEKKNNLLDMFQILYEVEEEDTNGNPSGNPSGNLSGGISGGPTAGAPNCEELGALNEWIKNAFKFVQYAGVGIAVVLTAVDFIQVIGGGKDEDLSKAFSKVVKRLIAVVLLLLTTVIVSFVIDIVNPVMDDASIPNCVK